MSSDSPSEVDDLLRIAEALRRKPSTLSGLGDQLDRAMILTRAGDPGGPSLVRETMTKIDEYPHVQIVDGNVYFSMHVRQLLDSSYWVKNSPATDPAISERIQSAVALLGAGDSEGLAQLEQALDEA